MPSHHSTLFPTEGPPVTYGSLRREEKWMGMSGKGSRCYNSTVNEPDIPRRPSVRDSLCVCHATGKNVTWMFTPCSLIYCLMSSKALGDPLIIGFSFFSPSPFTSTSAEHFTPVFSSRKLQSSVFRFQKNVMPLV